MTFGDLKGMVGQTIVYYVVKGCIIKAKRGKVSRGRDYYRNDDSLDLTIIVVLMCLSLQYMIVVTPSYILIKKRHIDTS